jgi:hypothetical protein
LLYGHEDSADIITGFANRRVGLDESHRLWSYPHLYCKRIERLAPAIVAFTGVFICCRRIIYQKPSNPNVH